MSLLLASDVFCKRSSSQLSQGLQGHLPRMPVRRRADNSCLYLGSRRRWRPSPGVATEACNAYTGPPVAIVFKETTKTLPESSGGNWQKQPSRQTTIRDATATSRPGRKGWTGQSRFCSTCVTISRPACCATGWIRAGRRQLPDIGLSAWLPLRRSAGMRASRSTAIASGCNLCASHGCPHHVKQEVAPCRTSSTDA